MRDFKFFQKPDRVFTDYMDQMDDYFLGGIVPNNENTISITDIQPQIIDSMMELQRQIDELGRNYEE